MIRSRRGCTGLRRTADRDCRLRAASLGTGQSRTHTRREERNRPNAGAGEIVGLSPVGKKGRPGDTRPPWTLCAVSGNRRVNRETETVFYSRDIIA